MEEPFAGVLDGTRPGHVIYEDERTFAFVDVEGATLGHTLVVSRATVDHVHQLTNVDYDALWATVRRVAIALAAVSDRQRVVQLVAGFEFHRPTYTSSPRTRSSRPLVRPTRTAADWQDCAAQLRQKLGNNPS